MQRTGLRVCPLCMHEAHLLGQAGTVNRSEPVLLVHRELQTET
jgi:hypothetical protein